MSLKTSFSIFIRNQDYLQRIHNRQLPSLVIESYSSPLMGKYKKKQNQKQGYHRVRLYPLSYFYYIYAISAAQRQKEPTPLAIQTILQLQLLQIQLNPIAKSQKEQRQSYYLEPKKLLLVLILVKQSLYTSIGNVPLQKKG